MDVCLKLLSIKGDFCERYVHYVKSLKPKISLNSKLLMQCTYHEITIYTSNKFIIHDTKCLLIRVRMDSFIFTMDSFIFTITK